LLSLISSSQEQISATMATPLRRSSRLAALGTGAPLPAAPQLQPPQQQLQLQPPALTYQQRLQLARQKDIEASLRATQRFPLPRRSQQQKSFSFVDLEVASQMTRGIKQRLDAMERLERKEARAREFIRIYKFLLGPARIILAVAPPFREAVLLKCDETMPEVRGEIGTPLPPSLRARLAAIIRETRYVITQALPKDRHYLTRVDLPMGWYSKKHEASGRTLYYTKRGTATYERPTRIALGC
jgi:hypothetical protein